MSNMKTIFFAAAMIFLCTAGVRASDESDQTVTATGHATSAPRPEILRMTMLVSAQSSDIRDALTRLKANRDRLNDKLTAAGANKDSIKFSDPVEGDQPNLTPQQRMMQQMMARNQRPASTQPAGVTISSTLTVEWPLPTSSPDDALAAAIELQKKIKNAIPKSGVGGGQTPEEQEIAEEMAAQQNNGTDTKPDEPQFLFVHRLSDDERAKLLAAAFADAQTQARRLAAAAGKDIGSVAHIANSAVAEENPAAAYVEAMMQSENPGQETARDDEATGSQVNDVKYTVTVAVTFNLK